MANFSVKHIFGNFQVNWTEAIRNRENTKHLPVQRIRNIALGHIFATTYPKQRIQVEFFKQLTIENKPETIQTINAKLTLPVYMRTPVGDTNMPEPIIEPTITVQPLTRLIFAFNVTSPPPPSSPSEPLLIGLVFVSPSPFIIEFLGDDDEVLRFKDSVSILIYLIC
uniref:Uncharacterized protein n=1 Tax=Glossina austeni TaxID=7395 RepID=A0A1A9V7N0_GLOAU